MKRFISLLLLIIPFLFFYISCNSRDTIVEPGNLTPADKEVAANSGIFGMNLLNEIVKTEPDSNIIISPLSVSTALGMTLNGANGSTYTQMKNTLQLSGNTQTEVNQSFQNLNNILNSADPKVTFTTDNSIWCRQGLSFEQSFLGVNKKYFNAYVQTLNFGDPASIVIINNWVSNNTNGKITQIIDKIEADAVMFLINAIYFKAEWQNKFDSLLTRPRLFNMSAGSQVQCLMMNQQNNFNYYKGTSYGALEIPYGNGNYDMLIILPNDNIDLNHLLSQVNGNLLYQINAGLAKHQVNLYLPRFQVYFNLLLNNPLINIGMVDAFGPGADFSNISKTLKLFISKVIHKTYIKVGEEGTEAAAVTAVVIDKAINHSTEIETFSVDHPFIFLITEKNSGAILFAGKVVNPLN
jgi:serpin B